MDETYGTYVDDECFDIHDYDDDTDDDTAQKNDTYGAAGAAPGPRSDTTYMCLTILIIY